MSWRRGLVRVLSSLAFLGILSSSAFADDAALWREYGLVHTSTTHAGGLTVTAYQMKDPTGALAAWEWIRSPEGRPCAVAALCNQAGARTIISEYNYVLVFDGGSPTAAQLTELWQGLPGKIDSSLPPILTFLPQQGLVPNSARYVLGPASLAAFAPELGSAKVGFDKAAEAQVAAYQLGNASAPVRLAIFYYAAPDMARDHAADLKRLANVHVKRSGVLVAVVLPPATAEQGDTLLSRIQYEAKITWNDVPPPSPIKPLYALLVNIIYFSIALSALCLVAGLIYAGMRVYRRRFGTLDSEEAMTTLHLTGD